jgi:hypothetical protein
MIPPAMAIDIEGVRRAVNGRLRRAAPAVQTVQGFLVRVRDILARLDPVRIGVVAAGTLGGVLVVASDFATLRSVKVLTASCSDLAQPSLRGACVTHGGEEHAYALVLLGLVALAMTWGAGVGRSRPAALALAVIGAAVIGIALATDVPDIHKTGVLGERFEQAHAQAGPGLWMELVGGALLFVAGVVASTLRQPRRRTAQRTEGA